MNKFRSNIVGGFAVLSGLFGLAGSMPAHAQSSVEIFGDMSVGVVRQSGTNAPDVKMQSSLSWANSFGFRGREDLGGGTHAIFALVSSVDPDTGTIGNATAYFKNSYVGLQNAQWGTVMFGRNDQLMSMLCSLDVMCWRGLIHSLRPGNLDRVGGGQLSNMVRYHSPDLGPFRFKAYGVLGEKATTPHGRAAGVQADYRSQNLQIGAAYETINNGTIAPGSAGGGIGVTTFFGQPSAAVFNLDKTEIGGIGARYTMGSVALYGLATKVKLHVGGQQNALKSYSIGSSWQVSGPVEIAGGCARASLDPSRWTTCEVRATYSFSKRTSVYIADVHQKASGAFARPQLFLQGGFGSVGGSTNLIGAGVRHIF